LLCSHVKNKTLSLPVTQTNAEKKRRDWHPYSFKHLRGIN